MQIKLFTIPITGVEDFNKELNGFLSSNKIIEIEKQLIQTDTQVFWCFYISYIPKAIVGTIRQNENIKRKKIDYKEVLAESEFKKFEELREIRKELAKEDAVSAFVIATDAELSEIAKIKDITLASLKKIKGFGDKKAQKYGERILKTFERSQGFKTSKKATT